MMIFNKTYDKSLWLMLCSDKLNRDKIIDFLHVIPMELYNKLRISLGFYVNKEIKFSINKNDEFYKSFFNGEVKTSGDMRYWYMIDPITGALSLGENLFDGEIEYDFFHMVIYPIDEKILNDEVSYNDCLIGEITDGCFNDCFSNKISDVISFHLIRFSFCDIVVSSCKSSRYMRNKYRFIDLDKMPDKYSFNNLNNKDSIKKLLRSKKKSR